jgi:hypothetical protein
MKDMQMSLEKLRIDAAECGLIRDLATDPAKELFTAASRQSRNAWNPIGAKHSREPYLSATGIAQVQCTAFAFLRGELTPFMA